jgi:hypothetical protein
MHKLVHRWPRLAPRCGCQTNAALAKRPEHPVWAATTLHSPPIQRTEENTMGRTSKAGYEAWGRHLHRLLGNRKEPTVPTTYRRTVLVTLCAVALLAVSGCGSGGTTSSASPPTTTAASQTYSSKAFSVPLTVTVDPALKSPPKRDSPHFLTWLASESQNAVRFLVPVVVFSAGKETPQAPPKDYLKYLMAQAKGGAVFSNVTKTTVDGHPATLMDATTNGPEGVLSGLLGCPERVSNKHKDCFGLQPGYVLRLAVIDVGDTTLLTWTTAQGAPDEEFFAMFEHMLQSVQFR